MLQLAPEAGGEEQLMREALRGISGPLLRNLRRFEVLRAVLEALPAELQSVCAPYDVRMAPRQDEPAAAAGSAEPHVNTVYLYVGSPTASALIEQRKRVLLDRVNAALSTQLVEDFRCEHAGAGKIAEQLNILRAAPD